MAEEKKEKWLNYLALTTVILAVCATLSTFKGGSYSTRAVMSQSRASDQWSYFQAKGIKGYLYDLQREKLELDLKAQGGKVPHSVADAYQEKIASYTTKVKKYEEERATIEHDARELEATRDRAQLHAKVFGMAVIFLQIAILLSSIAALMKKKPVWVAGLVVGVVGIFYFIDGFLLFLK